MLLLLFASVVVLLLLLHLFFTWNFSYWRDRGVPHLKPRPFFGNIRESTLCRTTFTEDLKFLYDSFPRERYVGMFHWRKPALLVRDPELAKQMLLKDFVHFHDRGIHCDEVHDPLTAHLINLGGARWKALRYKLTPAFTSGKLKGMLPMMAECTHDMVGHLGLGDGVVDVRETMSRFTTDVIGTCAFGLKFEALSDTNSEFRRMGRISTAPSLASCLRRTARLTFPELAQLLGVCQYPQSVTDFFSNLIREVLDLRQDEKSRRNDFLQLLLQLRNEETDLDEEEEGKKLVLNDKLLAAQAFVFFLAGFETTASTLTFCLCELAHNPDIQRKLREEIRGAFQRCKNDELTYESLQELPYLEMVISETLRKYPPAGMLFRECTKGYEVPHSSLEIKPGTGIIFPVYALHHDPAFYPEPARFDPQRFTEEAKAERHPFTYIPFGEGPRTCIGLRFAQLEMKMALTHLLNNYMVEPHEYQLPIKFDPKTFVLQSTETIYLKFEPCKQ